MGLRGLLTPFGDAPMPQGVSTPKKRALEPGVGPDDSASQVNVPATPAAIQKPLGTPVAKRTRSTTKSASVKPAWR